MNKRTVGKLIGVILILVVWQVLYWTLDLEMLLASPFQVVKRLFELLKERDFYTRTLLSASHIFGGFITAFLSGIILSILAGKFTLIEDILWPVTVIAKAVPVASFIVLFLIWFDTDITHIICFLIAFPIIYTNSLNGYKNADEKLLETANLYRVSFVKKLYYVYMPAMKNFIISASTVAIGMSWKSGVAAEVIGVARGTIGEQLNEAKLFCNNADLLAWTLVIVLSSIIFEKLFVLLLKLIFGRLK